MALRKVRVLQIESGELDGSEWGNGIVRGCGGVVRWSE
jgi:hypothetical protein